MLCIFLQKSYTPLTVGVGPTWKKKYKKSYVGATHVFYLVGVCKCSMLLIQEAYDDYSALRLNQLKFM